MPEKCVQGIENREKIVAIDERVSKTERYIGKIFEKIELINESLMGRPSWLVTTIISLLTGMCGALLTALVRVFIAKG